MSVCSVLVVDDDFYALEAVKLLSRDDRTRVWGAADSIDSAVELLERADVPGPDVVLLDVRFGNDERAGIVGLPRIASAAGSTMPLSRVRSRRRCTCSASAGFRSEKSPPSCISPNTVSSRIKTAYQVLGAGSRQEAFAKLVERERNGVGDV